MATPLQTLAQAGQSAWVDLLSRPFVRDGELAALIERGIVGVTSNPTIFQKAIAEGNAYDEQLRGLFDHETDAKAWKSSPTPSLSCWTEYAKSKIASSQLPDELAPRTGACPQHPNP